MSKAGQIKAFKRNVEIEVVISLQCVICGTKRSEVSEDNDDPEDIDMDKMTDTLAEKAYNDGWRESTSQYYGHTGIHCPKCHENRNKKSYFENQFL